MTRRQFFSVALVAVACLWSPPGWLVPVARGQSRPQRIVSLVPSVTEMLFAMDAGGQVAGVSSYDHFPPAVESLPKVGALVDPDFERIVSLRPDLVIVYGTQDDLIARLGRVQIPVFHYKHAGLADITDTITSLGGRVGRVSEAAREVARLQREIADVRRQVANRPHPKTVLIFGRELGTLRGIFASGGIGFMHDMLEAAGGVDVFADIKRQSVQATTELLLARAPEVILETYPSEGWTPARVEQERRVWQTMSTLPAVRANRIYILADDSLLVPGPRVGAAIRAFAKVLNGDVSLFHSFGPNGDRGRF